MPIGPWPRPPLRCLGTDARSDRESTPKAASWTTPADVKAKYGSASILKDGWIVFNICGNEFRLVVWINYDFYAIYLRFSGTHQEYDEIDAQSF